MKYLFIFIAQFVIINFANSQTAPYVIDQNYNSCCGGGGVTGSSFKVFGVGQIDSIRIYPRNTIDYTSTIKFFKGNGPNPDSLLYTQSFSVTGNSITTGNNEKLIILTIPVLVKMNSVYTFYIEGTPISMGYSNVYADGSYWDASGENTSKDVDFIIYVGTVTTTSISNALSNDILIQKSNNDRTLNVINSNKNYHLTLYNTNAF